MIAIAKYFPVERMSIEAIKEEAGDGKSTGEPVIREIPEKPKLFAVTQDIEVGDEVWDLFKGVKHGIAEKVHEVYIELKDVSYYMDRTSGGAVKVLGPCGHYH